MDPRTKFERVLRIRVNDVLSDKHDTLLYFQFFNAALDIIKSKIGKPTIIPVSKKHPPTNRCHITFNNKALDFINIHKIMKDKDVRNALPLNLRDDTPTIVYELTDTIRSKLLNYKKFVQSIDVDAFLSDNTILPCECDHSPFINHDHGHIISGDLNIVSDVKLRDMIAKGTKYREPSPFPCDRAKDNIIIGLDKCIESWSNKAGITKAAFNDWKNMITDRINDRISSLNYNNNKKSAPSILKG